MSDDGVTQIQDAMNKALSKKPRDGKKKDAKVTKIPAGQSREMPYDVSFPEGCPIEPLGVNGEYVYILDELRQLRVLKAKEVVRMNIMSLFGRQTELLCHYWPSYNKDRVLSGWRPEQGAESILGEAARRGVWDAQDRVRGPGCWEDQDGNLVMHCGNVLYAHGKTYVPGSIGRHVYPAAPPRPVPTFSGDDVSAAEELLNLLKTWRWRRPDLDPHLLLGWIGAAILGGALDWRPLVWITGDKATGKSTLHKVIELVMGPSGMIRSEESTAAGLWQTVGHASLPVALDELEAEEDNRKAQSIIKLARVASSGGQILRGGSDHKNSSFTVRSCFLFSSILIPPMLGQDLSRMAILALDDFPKGTVTPALDKKKLGEIGQKIRGRLLSNWPRLAQLIDTYKHQLAAAGHGGRGADQFGTLLACHDLLLYDAAPDGDTLNEWSVLLDRNVLAECEDDLPDHEKCINTLLSMQLDLWRSGERRTVGDWITEATKTTLDGEGAGKALMGVGLRVSRSPGGEYILYVANAHSGLSQLFKETHWAGRSGANGVWSQALRRIDGAAADQQRFGGVKLRCTAIPLSSIFSDDDEE